MKILLLLYCGYHFDYRKLLDESGVKYNKNIKNPEKLKEIYELNKPVVTTIPDKKVKT